MMKIFIFIFLLYVSLSAQQHSYSDTLFIDTGQTIACFIYDIHDTFIQLYRGLNIKPAAAPLAKIDSIRTAERGLIYQSSTGFISDIQVFIKNRPDPFASIQQKYNPKKDTNTFEIVHEKKISGSQADTYPAYPDTIFLDTGATIPCFIYDIFETYIKLHRGSEARPTTAPLSKIDSIYTKDKGCIYQLSKGFLIDINSFVRNRYNPYASLGPIFVPKRKDIKISSESSEDYITLILSGDYLLLLSANNSMLSAGIQIGKTYTKSNAIVGIGINYLKSGSTRVGNHLPLYFFLRVLKVKEIITPIFSAKAGYGILLNKGNFRYSDKGSPYFSISTGMFIEVVTIEKGTHYFKYRNSDNTFENFALSLSLSVILNIVK